MADNRYTADRRLYTDAAGNVVEADDPNRASLLVGQGGTLSMEDAQRYGLLDAEGKAVSGAPQNKAMSGPAETKGAQPATGEEAENNPDGGASAEDAKPARGRK